MGVIDLNRNRGINITDKPNAGVSTSGFNDLSRSLASVERANQNLARGIAHVGDTFFKIYNDRADERNRQEVLEGQTALFDFSQAEKDKLSEDLRTGKYLEKIRSKTVDVPKRQLLG